MAKRIAGFVRLAGRAAEYGSLAKLHDELASEARSEAESS